MAAVTFQVQWREKWRRVGSASLSVVLFVSGLLGCASEKEYPTAIPGLPTATPPGSFPVRLPPVSPVTEPPPGKPIEEYRIGVGDVIEVSLFRQNAQENDDLRRQLTVRPDGRISYFFIGDVQAMGLTIPEIRREITQQLSAYIRSPEVAVILVEMKGRVYVVGEVVEQGVRELKPGRGDAILDAIFLSKGLTKKADVDRAYVIRRNAIIPVQLGDLLLRGDRSKTVALQSEDILYIPEVVDQRIFVLGRVRRPGAFEISRPIRVTEAIALAEDFLLGAKRDQVKIIRGGLPRGPEPPEVVTANMEEILAGTREDVYVQRGDIVFAPITAMGQWNEIMAQISPTIATILLAVIAGATVAP
jgi:polysaccharide export outer membrane protein